MAAGFQLVEQSGMTLGAANAGTTTNYSASVEYFNPAAMVFFDHATISASAVGVMPNIQFTPVLATDLFGNPLSCPNGSPNCNPAQSPATNALIPGLYAIYPLNKQFAIGISSEVPFGLKTVYDPASAARYFATESSISSLNINPSIAMKVLDNFSVGFGVDLLRTNATLDQAVDANSITSGFVPHDLIVENKAKDWGLGWNMGLLWKATSTTEIGFGYHSKINLDLKGDSTIIGLPNNLAIQNLLGFYGLHDAFVEAPLTLPDYATISIKQSLKPWWNVMADFSYTHWSTINKILLNFTGNRSNINNPNNLPPSITTVDYRNTWRFAVGEEFVVTPNWRVRMGLAYDQSPVRDENRDARLPDTNRYWVAAGTNFKFNDRMDLDLGYAHIFFNPASINRTNTVANVFVQNLVANYSANANLVGVQLNYHFNA